MNGLARRLIIVGLLGVLVDLWWWAVNEPAQRITLAMAWTFGPILCLGLMLAFFEWIDS